LELAEGGVGIAGLTAFLVGWVEKETPREEGLVDVGLG